ncbi:hypothetical protein Plhal304r1_c033g0105241 [Plasmopara halstedii]
MSLPLTSLPPITEEINANTDIADTNRGKSALAQDRALATIRQDAEDNIRKFATHMMLKLKKSGSPSLQTAMNYLSCLKGILSEYARPNYLMTCIGTR